MLEQILPLLISALVAALVVPVMQGLKKLSAFIDTLPSYAKRVIVILLAYGTTLAFSAIGAPIPEDVLNMDGEAVSAVLSALFAFLGHFLLKRDR